MSAMMSRDLAAPPLDPMAVCDVVIISVVSATARKSHEIGDFCRSFVRLSTKAARHHLVPAIAIAD
jgi:hypothetical protein